LLISVIVLYVGNLKILRPVENVKRNIAATIGRVTSVLEISRVGFNDVLTKSMLPFSS